ncbi:hypothetical protein ACIRPU_22920 [Streptomyces sp. NPDC102259]|uniref:hypothetical protein n=1 Tax=Streptomyces sp. NPDC102259 TaxID=3366148 RepID=UPI003808E2E3
MAPRTVRRAPAPTAPSRPSGTVKAVRTAADGTLSTTVRGYADGSYLWSYAGTAGTAAAVSAGAVSAGAFVDVVG